MTSSVIEVVKSKVGEMMHLPYKSVIWSRFGTQKMRSGDILNILNDQVDPYKHFFSFPNGSGTFQDDNAVIQWV